MRSDARSRRIIAVNVVLLIVHERLQDGCASSEKANGRQHWKPYDVARNTNGAIAIRLDGCRIRLLGTFV